MVRLMSNDPIQFLNETFPALFHKGVADLRAKAEGGDAKSQKILDDVVAADGAVVLELEGEGATTVYLHAKDGEMKVLDAAPAPETVSLAVAAPGPGLAMLLGEAAKQGELEEERAAQNAVRTASKRLQDALADKSLLFHVVVEDVPELGTVTTRVGLNAATPPADPSFTATIKYADLEEARTGNVNPQMLFMSGKLRMEGDYSFALQLGMQLMAQAQAEGLI